LRHSSSALVRPIRVVGPPKFGAGNHKLGDDLSLEVDHGEAHLVASNVRPIAVLGPRHPEVHVREVPGLEIPPGARRGRLGGIGGPRFPATQDEAVGTRVDSHEVGVVGAPREHAGEHQEWAELQQTDGSRKLTGVDRGADLLRVHTTPAHAAVSTIARGAPRKARAMRHHPGRFRPART
jgi:hypothetical protein